MPNLIDFLEILGQDARLRYANKAAVEQELARAGIEPALRAALLGDDPRLLEKLLGARTNVCCVVHAPEDDEEEPEDDDQDDPDGDDEGGKEDGESTSGRAALRRVATAA